MGRVPRRRGAAHAAFGIESDAKAPAILRPRVEQFVRLFDARLIQAHHREDGTWEFVPVIPAVVAARPTPPAAEAA